jgi:hypothetical protein
MAENNLVKEINVKVNTDNIKAEMKRLTDAESRIKELEEENEKLNDFFDKNTGHGTIGLTADMKKQEMNGRNTAKEFDSIEELIEYCRVNDKESYQKIKDKTYSVLTGNNFSWSDTFSKDEKENDVSLIGRTIQRLNADYRKKIRG